MEKQANFLDMAKAVADPFFQEYGKKHGLLWAGWDTGKNLRDRLKDQKFKRELQAALGVAAESDAGKFKQLLRGIHAMAGIPATPAMDQHLDAISGDYAKFAPYLMQWMPDTYDQLHGSAGSTAQLTHAIAQANRHQRNFTPHDAAAQAQAIVQNLYGANDPMRHRGYGTADMGRIYQQAMQRGLVSPHMDPATASEILSQTAGVLSAGRDIMGGQGLQPSIEDQFELYDKLPAGNSAEETEMQLLRGGLAGRRGGPFMAAHHAQGGGFTPGPDQVAPREMAAQHAQLTQRAASSPIGNMAAATVRVGQEIGFQPGTPAAQLLTQVQSGEIPDLHANQWVDILARSGIDRSHASAMLSQSVSNVRYMTPQLAQRVQAAQHRIDLQPRISRIKSQYGPGMASQEVMRGHLDRLATNFGYRGGFNHMNQLHQTAQGVPAVMGGIDQQAKEMQAASGVGRGNWISRTSDAVRTATPQTSVRDIIGRGLGAIPKSQFPAQ